MLFFYILEKQSDIILQPLVLAIIYFLACDNKLILEISELKKMLGLIVYCCHMNCWTWRHFLILSQKVCLSAEAKKRDWPISPIP